MDFYATVESAIRFEYSATPTDGMSHMIIQGYPWHHGSISSQIATGGVYVRVPLAHGSV